MMAQWKPERVVAVVGRSGGMGQYSGAAQGIANLQIAGVREVSEAGEWYKSMLSGGSLRVAAIEPGTGHACTNSRFLAVAFIESVLDADAQKADVWGRDVFTGEIGLYESMRARRQSVCRLGDERFARKWRSFVTTGQVGDVTPPPASFDVVARIFADGGIGLQWRGEADIESGINQFNIYRIPARRDKVGRVYGQGWNRGDEPDPIDCVMAYTDYAEGSSEDQAKLKYASYRVSAMNFVGVESDKSDAVEVRGQSEKSGTRKGASMSGVIRNPGVPGLIPCL